MSLSMMCYASIIALVVVVLLSRPQFRDPQVRGPQFRGSQVRGPLFRGPQVRGPQVRGPQFQGPQSAKSSDCADKCQPWQAFEALGSVFIPYGPRLHLGPT
jgi:hypothetical protein